MSSSLLERGELPIEMLVEMAVREGRRPRAIYQMHKWFARRLPSVVRATLIAAAPPLEDCTWEELFYDPPRLTNKTVLDPFVGGGTTVVEASRLGADVHGFDIDPVACFVTQQELRARTIPELRDSLGLVRDEVWGKVQELYAVEADSTYLALHFFWVQRIVCGGCSNQIDAHHNYVLSSEASYWLLCPHCKAVFEGDSAPVTSQCPQCTSYFSPYEGPLKQGVVSCSCGFKTRLIDYGRQSQKPPLWELCAIEAIPKTAKRHPVPNKDRKFFAPQAGDMSRYLRAGDLLQNLIDSDVGLIPTELIPTGSDIKDHRLLDYGYRRWIDLFNSRQLLHLALTTRAIRALPDEIRHLHALAFSNHLTTNCMLTSYAAGWRRLTPLFSLRGYRHINRPVELNPWLQGTGRGTYPNAIRQIEQGRAASMSPKELQVGGGFVSVLDLSPGSSSIRNSDSSAGFGLEPNSIDIVLSDPPYFDNVVYSELSEFFGVWLRFLGCLPDAPKHSEVKSLSLVSRSRHYDSTSTFVTGLAQAFKGISSVLKPAGVCAFTYRHSTPDGWQALHDALVGSELRAVQVLPVPGELGSGLHAHPGTNLWDALIVLRPSRGFQALNGLGEKQKRLLDDHVAMWNNRLQTEKRIPFGIAAKVNLCRAVLIAGSLGFLACDEADLTPIKQVLYDQPEDVN